mmetsp:Transcript_14616/g.63301  ORF Transcript_14616/g.63301 Transcript_14616/m.63301 type:complete len:258 (-) Transcript_14616:2228-3001(-)
MSSRASAIVMSITGWLGSATPRCVASRRFPSRSSRGLTPLRDAAARTRFTAAARTPASLSSSLCRITMSAAVSASRWGSAAAAAAKICSADSRIVGSLAAASMVALRRRSSARPSSFISSSPGDSFDVCVVAASRSTPRDARAGAASRRAERTPSARCSASGVTSADTSDDPRMEFAPPCCCACSNTVGNAHSAAAATASSSSTVSIGASTCAADSTVTTYLAATLPPEASTASDTAALRSFAAARFSGVPTETIAR